MKPLFFDAGDRRLYGAYHPPTGSWKNFATVLCYPLSIDYVRTHQAYRLLAQMFADRGVAAFRFDYAGTGDSQGEPTRVTLETWADDILAAVRTLKQLASISKIGLFGMRGASFILPKVDLNPRSVPFVALVDPVGETANYVQQLRRTDRERFPQPLFANRTRHELLAEEFHQDLLSTIAALSIDQLVGSLPSKRLLLHTTCPDDEFLSFRAAAENSRLRTAVATARYDWNWSDPPRERFNPTACLLGVADQIAQLAHD